MAVKRRLTKLPLQAALTLIRGYQLLLSPLLGPRCRYLPSCSDYAREALLRHGLIRGSFLAFRRVSRCHPFGGHGYDPVPDVVPRRGWTLFGRHVQSGARNDVRKFD
jgi:putative membrane protein insertion efficiency factor